MYRRGLPCSRRLASTERDWLDTGVGMTPRSVHKPRNLVGFHHIARTWLQQGQLEKTVSDDVTVTPFEGIPVTPSRSRR